MMNTRSCSGIVLLIVTGCVSLLASAQTFPVKPVRGVVSAAPGGGNDLVARILAPHITEYIKQPFVIENRGGAGGVVGTDYVAKSPPDGYTLAMCFVNFSISPSLYKKLPFDPVHDFSPITTLAGTPLILVVHPSLPVKSVKQLVALAKSRAGELNIASTGKGSLGHLAGELFKGDTGTNMVSIPYKGGAPAIAAVLSGEVQLYFSTVPAAQAQIKAGRLRALAVTSEHRIASAPDLPTIAEGGFPGYNVTGWFGLLAPAGTPQSVVTFLNIEVNRVLKRQDVKEKFASNGLETLGSSPEEFISLIRSEIEKWSRVARSAGIVPE